jgi:hypothetical protein
MGGATPCPHVRDRPELRQHAVMCASMKTAYVVTRSWSSQVTFTRLLAHYTRLFPGAPPPLIAEGGSQQIREQKLYEVLSQPGLPDEISTKWLGQ